MEYYSTILLPIIIVYSIQKCFKSNIKFHNRFDINLINDDNSIDDDNISCHSSSSERSEEKIKPKIY